MSFIRWRRALAVTTGVFAVLLLCGAWYVAGFDLDRVPRADPAATPADIAFLASPAPPRGRMLAVVSSATTIGSGRRGGFELTELSRAYYVFAASGYAVDVASTAGGKPLAIVDEDLVDVDHAFLNDPDAQAKLADTMRLADVDPARYAGVYFVGGKGAMIDFPADPDVARIVAAIDAAGGVIGAVCHGPAALSALRRGDGRPWLEGRRLTAFTNAEELFLIEDAHAVFGTLLEDRLRAAGGVFDGGPMYLQHVVVDGRLVTGQNPWSTWGVAEAMVRALGHAPAPRARTGEEFAVDVLAAYRRDGYDAARALRAQRPQADVRLVLLHALIAGMRGELHDAFQLQRLAHG